MTRLSIYPATFSTWLANGEELAVLDLRAAAVFGKGGPLYATNLPAHRVLGEIDRYVPRRAVRAVLVDGGDGAAERLVPRLRAEGWTDLHAVAGGLPAWIAASGPKRPTFDTPGVTFATRVRDTEATPVIDAGTLARLMVGGADVVVLDTRTVEEYVIEHVPGAIAVPGAELLLRFADLVPSPDALVVVSCAGLPRAILGAQTLIDAGVPNPVAYLDDGTRAWRAAGFALEGGLTAAFGPDSRRARVRGEELAARLAVVDDVAEISLPLARAWQADPDRTTYLLDVRTPAEYARAHLPDTISSPGGQLFGVAFRTLAVRGARVVLVDDLSGIRAATTAHWLRRRGFELAILRHPFAETILRAVA